MEYRILGPLEVRREGITLDLGGPKQRALLARLLVAGGRVVSVDRLAEDVWSGEPPAAASGIIQSYVSNLRRVLEPERAARAPAQVLLTRPPGYMLAFEPSELDAAMFEGELAEGRAALEAGDPARAEQLLAHALGRWRGEALADVSGEPFAVAEATRLEELRQTAIDERVDAALALGRAGAAVAELEALVAHHPLRERRRGQLMLALYRSGRQADALRVYSEGRARLVEELGLEPGPDLQRLEDLVLRQSSELDWQPPTPPQEATAVAAPSVDAQPEPAPVAASTPTPPAGMPVPPPAGLVGRERELAILDTALSDALERRGHVVLVAGEAGIGKTSLTEELAARARRRGAVVVEGRGYEGEGTPPYWPWLQALRLVLASVPQEQVAPALTPGAAELAQLLPEIKELVPGFEPAPVAADAVSARFRLADSITGALVRLSTHAPLVILLDDLHWSDAASMFVLRFLAGSLRNAAVLAVGTYRPDERSAQLDETLAALAREPTLLRVDVSGLTPDDVGAVLAAYLETPTDPALAAAVRERTAGNPFFVHEIARSLADAPGATSEVLARVPAGVRAVLERRLRALPEPTREVLEVAAVTGRAVDLAMLDAVVDDALEHVEPALLDGVLLAADGSVSRLRFVHDLLRETVLDGLSSVRRARLHGRVGRALAASGAAQPDELAEHFWAAAHAGFADDAIATALAAAEHSLSVYAQERTDEHLTRTLALLERQAVSPERDRLELQVQTRLSLLRQQTHGVASPEVGDAVRRAQVLARSVGSRDELLRASFAAWAYYVVHADLEDSRVVAEELLAEGEKSGDDRFTVAGLTALGNTTFHLGELATSKDVLERAIEMSPNVPEAPAVLGSDPESIAGAFLGPTMQAVGDGPAAVAAADAAIRHAEETGRQWDLAHSTMCAAWAAAMAGDVARTQSLAERSIEVAEARSFPFYRAMSMTLRGWARGAAGDAEGEAELLEGLEAFESSGAHLQRTMFIWLHSDLLVLQGREHEALARLDQALDVGEMTSEHIYDSELHRRRAELLAAKGARDEAAGALRYALETARAINARLFEQRALDAAAKLGIELPA